VVWRLFEDPQKMQFWWKNKLPHIVGKHIKCTFLLKKESKDWSKSGDFRAKRR
jgi:hypothetical protein